MPPIYQIITLLFPFVNTVRSFLFVLQPLAVPCIGILLYFICKSILPKGREISSVVSGSVDKAYSIDLSTVFLHNVSLLRNKYSSYRRRITKVEVFTQKKRRKNCQLRRLKQIQAFLSSIKCLLPDFLLVQNGMQSFQSLFVCNDFYICLRRCNHFRLSVGILLNGFYGIGIDIKIVLFVQTDKVIPVRAIKYLVMRIEASQFFSAR